MLQLREEGRKPECSKRIRYQGSGQEAFAQDETPSGCEACDEAENNIWMLIFGLDSLHSDGIVHGGRQLFDSGAALSACPPQFCAGITTRPTPGVTPQPAAKWSSDLEIRRENNQASTSEDRLRRQFPGCRRSQTRHCGQRLDGDGLRSRILQARSVLSDGRTELEAATGTRTISPDS